MVRLDLGLPNKLLKLFDIIITGLLMHFNDLLSYSYHGLQLEHFLVVMLNRGNGSGHWIQLIPS